MQPNGEKLSQLAMGGSTYIGEPQQAVVLVTKECRIALQLTSRIAKNELKPMMRPVATYESSCAKKDFNIGSMINGSHKPASSKLAGKTEDLELAYLGVCHASHLTPSLSHQL